MQIVSTGLLFLLSCGSSVHGLRILAMIPLFAQSHHNFMQPVLKSLAKAGHEVVVYTPFLQKNPPPNYIQVHMDNVATESGNITEFFLELMASPHYKCLDFLIPRAEVLWKEVTESEKVQKLIDSKEHFDLVIAEGFSAQESILIFGHIFKAPVIFLQAFMTNNIVNGNLGNALSVSHIPDVCTPYSDKMSFVERTLNSLYVARGLYYLYYYQYVHAMERTMRLHFPDMPPLMDMINNVSLVLVNDHPAVDYAQPRTPNIIPVAGIHIEDEEPLPKDIKKFMDEASDGVILFSLGTYTPDELESQEYFDMYINAFKQLKQRVIWKTRNENIKGIPKNVMTAKWLPQKDVLAHPNMALFITHGGLLSQHETINFGVPVVCIAQFWDQHRNCRLIEERGVGVQLKIKDLSTTTVHMAIRKVLDNPMYKENMQRLSRIFRDRPLSPAETVVFWTEYVARHHGAAHLKPASTQLSWYQLHLLDVIAAVLAAILMGIAVVFLLLRKLLTLIIGKTWSKLKTS